MSTFIQLERYIDRVGSASEECELITQVSEQHHSPLPNLRRWDEYLQQHLAAGAVRTRNDYFYNLLDFHVGKSHDTTLRVLKVDAGAGNSMAQWMNENPDTDIHFDCAEVCPETIDYPSTILSPHAEKISFIRNHSLQFDFDTQYDLIWSSGLFDYCSDRVFVEMLKRLLKNLSRGGKLVVGNFSKNHPHQAYIEQFDWMLHHRSEDDLLRLAELAGGSRPEVRREPLAMNLFLHLQRQSQC